MSAAFSEVAYLRRTTVERRNLNRTWLANAYRLVDAHGEDRIQPWPGSKAEALQTAKMMGWIVIEDYISLAQLNALCRWKDRSGRQWRTKLQAAWCEGNYQGFSDSGLLQQLRNTLGPNWLAQFKWPKGL